MSSSSSTGGGGDVQVPPAGSHAKVMQDRVTYVEHHLGKICGMLSDYALKTAALRDKNDEIAKALSKFAIEERYNTTTKLAMTVVSELIANVGDHKNAEVQRLEAKVLPPLSSYGNMCKHLKTEIKIAHNAEDRHVAKFKDVEKLRDRAQDPKFQSSITLANSELEKASAESYRVNFFCQDQLLKFEQKRIQDVKESLQKFIKIEILMHAKALELFSQAYQFIDSIDEEADLESLRIGMGLNKIGTVPRPGTILKNKSILSKAPSAPPSARTAKEMGRRMDAMMNLRGSKSKKSHSEGVMMKHDKKKAFDLDVGSGCSSDGDLVKYARSHSHSRQKKSKHTKSKSKDKKAVSFGDTDNEEGSEEVFEKINYSFSSVKHSEANKPTFKKLYF